MTALCDGASAAPEPAADVLLAEAAHERSQGHLGLAVIQAYQVLRSGRGQELEVATATHLFLSEALSEMTYHGLARVHARQALRTAEQVAPDDPCFLAPRHLRLASVLRDGGDNALAEAQLRRASALSAACPERPDALQAAIELETARLMAGRIGDPDEDAVSLLTLANEHLGRSKPVDSEGGRLPTWTAEAFLLQAILLTEAWHRMSVAERNGAMLDVTRRLVDNGIELVGSEPSQLRCRLLRQKATVFRLQGKIADACEVLQEDLGDSRHLQRTSTETVLGLLLCAARLENLESLGKLSSMMLDRDLHALAEFGTFATEGDQLAYAERLRIRGDTCISLLMRHQADAPALRERLLDFAVARKAVVTNAEHTFWQGVRQLNDETVFAACRVLAAEREELGARLAAGVTDGASQRVENIERRYQVLAIEPFWRSIQATDSAIRAQLERYMARLGETGSTWSAVEAARPTASLVPTGADIRAQMRVGTVIVEILRVREVDLAIEQLRQAASYWALIVSRDQPLEVIELGDAEDIDEAVRSTLHTLRTIDDLMDAMTQEAALRNLAGRLWHPLTNAIGDAERVLICAEGPIGLCPFAAFPTADGAFAIEAQVIQQVGSARDLLPVHIDQPKVTGAPNEVVIVAGVDFGDPANATVGGLGLTLCKLDQSLKEADAVRRAFTDTMQIIGGTEATATKLQGLASPRILHIVTHGFVLPESDNIAPLASSLEEDGWAAKSALARHLKRLSRSGLALSGFHGVQPGERADGMLTALAAGALDLRDTELVVLSACDSGLGHPAPNEGLVGLPRAFRAAGARAVLMSLWQLRDIEAATQMRAFYREFAEHQDPALALAIAQRESVKYLRRVLGKAPPAVWAPLCIIGAAGNYANRGQEALGR